jgi:hypothetical protein
MAIEGLRLNVSVQPGWYLFPFYDDARRPSDPERSRAAGNHDQERMGRRRSSRNKASRIPP